MAIMNIAPGMRKTWAARKTRDIRLRSIWEQFSNRTEALPSIPNSKDYKVPKDVLHYVNTEFEKGSYSCRIPLVEELRKDGIGGLQKAEGTGETRYALYADVFYNLVRKVVRNNTKGVENDATKYMRVAEEAQSAILDWFAGDKDYSCQMAILEAGDRYITDDQFWQDYQDMQTAPVKKVIHPNIAYFSMTAAPSRATLGTTSYNYTADMQTIVTALANLGPTNGFNLAALDNAINYASRFVAPLNWSAGSETVNYIILVSPMQARQLITDQTWIDLMRGAERRGPDNRAISGIIGTRLGALIVEDQRSPILDLAAQKFQYVTVAEAQTVNSFYGLGALNRSEKGAAGTPTGTMEIARILGRGALGVPTVHDISFKEEIRDFEHEVELCGSLSIGHNRMDFRGKHHTSGAETLRNISSALYFTATPTISY